MLRKRRRSGALSAHTSTIDNAWRLLKQAVPKSLALKKGHTYNPALIKHCRSWQWRWENTGACLFQKTAKVLNETVQSGWQVLCILGDRKNGAQKCAKTWEIEEKYKKMTLILLAHECRKHCKTQEKKQKTMARRMSSTEMCAKTMRLASNVYHMNAKNRDNVGSVSHPPGCLRCLRNLPCPIYTYIYTYICIYVCMYLGWGPIPWMWPWSTNTSCIGRICWLSHVKRIKQCHSLHEIHVPILLD